MSRCLNDKQKALAAQIKPLEAKGWSGNRIAAHLGVSNATVSRIRSRLRVESWLLDAYREMQQRAGSPLAGHGLEARAPRKRPADPSQLNPEHAH